IKVEVVLHTELRLGDIHLVNVVKRTTGHALRFRERTVRLETFVHKGLESLPAVVRGKLIDHQQVLSHLDERFTVLREELMSGRWRAEPFQILHASRWLHSQLDADTADVLPRREPLL